MFSNREGTSDINKRLLRLYLFSSKDRPTFHSTCRCRLSQSVMDESMIGPPGHGSGASTTLPMVCARTDVEYDAWNLTKIIRTLENLIERFSLTIYWMHRIIGRNGLPRFCSLERGHNIQEHGRLAKRVTVLNNCPASTHFGFLSSIQLLVLQKFVEDTVKLLSNFTISTYTNCPSSDKIYRKSEVPPYEPARSRPSGGIDTPTYRNHVGRIGLPMDLRK